MYLELPDSTAHDFYRYGNGLDGEYSRFTNVCMGFSALLALGFGKVRESKI
jgi:hypothetical protein